MKQVPLKLYLPAVLFLGSSMIRNDLSAQSPRLVIGNTSAVYMVMNGGTSATPIHLVIDNSSYDAITRNTGWILSEGEFNYVKWNVKNSFSAPNSYVIPWGYSTTTYIPLELRISAAGTETSAGSGTYFFSTYRTAQPANTPLPTSPAGINLSSSAGGGPLATIDRFWCMDAQGYTAGNKPQVNRVSFYYDDTEWNSALNTDIPIEGDLQAQRWNSTLGTWESGVFLEGTDYPADAAHFGNQSYVEITTAISAANFFKWWTLVNKFKPLPVAWLDFSAECNKGSMSVKWSTATEQNADYFTVERSQDGVNFSAIATVPATGNSSTPRQYSAVDPDPYNGTSFYRIRETDFDGNYFFTNNLTTSGCAGDDVLIYADNGGASVSINALADGEYTIEMYDMLGQKMMTQLANVAAGPNNIKLETGTIASAVYVVKVYNASNSVSRKIFIPSVYRK